VRSKPIPWGRRLVWALVVALFGPFGLLVYLLASRTRRRTPREAHSAN